MQKYLNNAKKLIKYNPKKGRIEIKTNKILALCVQFIYKHMLKLISLVTGLLLAWTAYSQLPLIPLTQTQYSNLANLSDAPDFTLAGRAYYGKIQSVYDGDTVKILIQLGDKVHRFDSRLNWIDTPELKTGLVKAFGAEVRDIVSRMILGKIVRVEAA